MIQGSFDFFFATGGGNGAEGAGVAATIGWGRAISPVVTFGGSTTGGGGGGVTGGGAGGDDAGGPAMSEVFGAPDGPVVGPVLRGSATVAG